MSGLRESAKEADALGLKYLQAKCSVRLGEALAAGKDVAGARGELERALDLSDRLGLAVLQAEGQHALATVSRSAGDTATAASNCREALLKLDEMLKDSGAERAKERSDLSSIEADCKSGIEAAKR